MTNISVKRKILVFLLAIVTLSAVAVSFSSVFFGLDMMDTFFMGSVYMSEKVAVFYPLSQGVFKSVVWLFGNNILWVRIVNWLFFLLACLMTAYVTYSVCRNKILSLLLFVCTVLIFPVAETNVFNGNSLSVFFLVGVVTSLYGFFYKSEKWIWGYLVCLVCLPLVRFPDIVLYPMLFISLLFLCNNKKQYLVLGGGVFLSMALYCAVCFGIYNGLDNYTDAFKQVFAKSALEDDSNHSLDFLLAEYFHTIKDIVSYMKYLSLIAVVPLVAYFLRKRIYVVGGAVFFALLTITYVCFKVTLFGDKVIPYHFLMLIMAGNVCMLFVGCVFALLQGNCRKTGMYLVMLFCSLSAAAGADTGLFLAVAPMVIFSPWITVFVFQDVRNASKKELLVAVLGCIGLVICAFVYVRQGLALLGVVAFLALIAVLLIVSKSGCMKKTDFDNAMPVAKYPIFSLAGLLLFALLSVCEKPQTVFHDKPLRELNVKLEGSVIGGIYTSESNHMFISEITRKARELGDKPVAFFGVDSHIFPYLLGRGKVENTDFWQGETLRNMCALEKAIIENKPVMFFCPISPVYGGEVNLSEYPKLVALMNKYNYSSVVYGKYAVFSPN